MNRGILPGFVYTSEILDRDGNVLSKQETKNIIPIQGLQFVASLMLGSGATPTSDWYVGVLNNGLAITENTTLQNVTSYENADYTTSSNARLAWDFTYDGASTITNAVARAEFVFTSARTIYGAFLTNTVLRGAYAGGVLLSVANFSTAQTIPSGGGTLRCTAGIILAST